MEDVATTLSLSENKKRTKSLRHPDRLTVSPKALERLNGWVADLEGQLKGINLTRNQLVQWLILSHADSLSAQELKQIEAEFFDELKFAEWAVRELKAAQARGERIGLADIVVQSRAAKPDKARVKTQSKRSQKRLESIAAQAEKQSPPTTGENVESRIFLEKTGVK